MDVWVNPALCCRSPRMQRSQSQASVRQRRWCPFLSYRVKPIGEGPVRVTFTLNGERVVDQTLHDRLSRTFNEVFELDILEDEGDELRVFVPDDEPGSATISNIIVFYTAFD